MVFLLRIFKLLILFTLVVLAGYAIWQRKLVTYGLSQLKGQVTIVMDAVPAEELLSSPTYPDSLKKKLKLIAEVRRFAMDSLGLSETDNYTRVYEQHGQPSLWVITACEPFALKEHLWEFPFLGKVSYKGYFEKEKGLEEVNELKRKGYDVDYSPAGGWSTLGWFSDPILSNMLRRTDGQLAELIIHEMTHATLYLPGSVEYNENFATFVGEQGALHFLSSRFGKSSTAYTDYIQRQEDDDRFGQYMLSACKRLDSLYNTFHPDTSLKSRQQKKIRLIADINSGITGIGLHKAARFRLVDREGRLANNTFFMSYSRYRSKQNEFSREFESVGGHLASFIRQQKEKANH